MRLRLRAIYKAIYHGLMPYWAYEQEKHYKGSYFNHMRINIKYAFRWATFREFESDIEFEKQTNKL